MVDDGRTDDGRTDDGRTTEHGYTISSPCEPDGSGELKIEEGFSKFVEGMYIHNICLVYFFFYLVNFYHDIRLISGPSCSKYR